MNLKAGIKGIKKLQQELNSIDAQAAKVEAFTISKIKERVPGIVSEATAAVYAINKGEVAQAHRTKAYLDKRAFKKANKAHLRTSFKGKNLSSLHVIFTGRKHANWNTKAKPKPKPRGGKVFSTEKKYTVYQTVLKKKPVPITPSGDNRVFVMMRKGRLIPMVVGNDNEPRVKSSTSVPQAVLNEQVEAIWRPNMKAYIIKTYGQQTKRVWASGK